MGMLRMLLYPFAVIFRIATAIRNHLFAIGHKRSFQFEIPVISVGNLSLGGSGKTPTIEYLIRLLGKNQKIATLSRGYGRQTKGLRFASSTDNASTLGDEPFQFYRNFGPEVKVVVGEDRAFAIPNILHEYQDTTVILLDDAFQHRSVRPHLNILLTDFSKPFFRDHLIPVGRLREGRVGAKRANIVIVTKCPPEINQDEQQKAKNEVVRYAGDKPVFFSYIKYGKPKPFFDPNRIITPKVVLVSGIAKAKPLEAYIRKNFELVRHFQFRDHHDYTVKEVNVWASFIRSQQEEVSLITTEKDMMRLLDPIFKESLKDLSCFYLPIEMNFVENGAEFDALVQNEIEKVNAQSNSGDE